MTKRKPQRPQTAKQAAAHAEQQRAAALTACKKKSPAVEFTFISTIKQAIGCEWSEAEKMFEQAKKDGVFVKAGE